MKASWLYLHFYFWLSTNGNFMPLLLNAHGIAVVDQLGLAVLASIGGVLILGLSSRFNCLGQDPRKMQLWMVFYITLSSLSFQFLSFSMRASSSPVWIPGLVIALDKSLCQVPLNELVDQISQCEGSRLTGSTGLVQRLSRNRMWGSIGWMIGHVACGLCISQASLDVLFLLNLVAGGCLVAALLLFLPSADCTAAVSVALEKKEGKAHGASSNDIGMVATPPPSARTRLSMASFSPFLTLPALLFLMMYCFYGYGSNTLLSTFSLSDLRLWGFTYWGCGLMVFAQTALEVPMFWYGGDAVAALCGKPLYLFALATAITGARVVIPLIVGSRNDPASPFSSGHIVFTCLLMCLHGFSFGASENARREFENHGLSPNLPTNRSTFSLIRRSLQIVLKAAGWLCIFNFGEGSLRTIAATLIFLFTALTVLSSDCQSRERLRAPLVAVKDEDEERA